MSRTVKLAGVDVEVVSDSEAETAQIRICSIASYFPDDVKGVCSACKTTIWHRPYGPHKPPKLCPSCALTYVKITEAND